MNVFELIFWILLFLVFYTYLGYGLVLYIIVKIKGFFYPKSHIINDHFEPTVTLFVAAYNEKDFIEAKVKNFQSLNYPKHKLQIIFVTDGSDDGTPDLLKNYNEITVLHQPERRGKIGAINRGMSLVKNPIVIYSDANAMLNSNAVKEIVKHYQDPKVGCVSGEKRIIKKDKDGASSAGEGFYWKYESFLKKYDYLLYSAVGAAGELFSIRTELHQTIEKDTILDDFIISLRIAQQGYIIAYEPKAYASEFASPSIKEEMKRKIRISAGGIQSIVRLIGLLNFFQYGVLTFQYISHRVLRWTITPLALLLLLPLNFALINENSAVIYELLLYGQLLFYSLALTGWFLENKQIKIKLLFIPFYFLFMNLCVFLGFFRFIKGTHSVLWEKAKRT
ncbi:glycosyltransferase family 2 protein [Vicingaceae bacterium]|jgi:cellulose synthase/poly-beta-1,6-N-acetylglucosamine synthase-like glycosyltransferase|nr:glycosyltransferase family 2 protein [Vicingaceae bacterium]